MLFNFSISNIAYALTQTDSPNNCVTSGGSGQAWSRPNRAETSNNSNAIADDDDSTTEALECTGYGFTIPPSAIITGITVNIERRASGGDSRDYAVYLLKANSTTGDNKASGSYYPGSDQVATYGNSSDLWGTSWTPADINGGQFGASLRVQRRDDDTVRVDYISIAVDYILDTIPPTITSINRADINPTSASSVNWTVIFSEDVTGVTAARFALVAGGGVTSPAITSVTGSGSVWMVTATRGSGTGTLGLNMATATGVTDAAGNALTGVPFTGQVYTIDPNAASQCFDDDFNRANGDPGSDWAVGKEGSSSFTPEIANQSLRLTDNSTSASTYATLNRIFPGAGNKIIVEFNEYSYGGSGADGMGIVLSDASKPLAAGAFGGSLGYAPKRADQGGDTTHEGFSGGWLGVGLDEFGNYSNPTEGRVDGPGSRPDAVAIRGSGSGYTGYNYLRGTGTLSPGLDTPSRPTTAPRYRIIVDHSDSVHAWTSVERDTTGTGNNYSFIVPVFDAKVYPTQAPVPTNWLLSYTGATGGSANVHEIDALRVCSVTQSTPVLHHIQLEYPARTCGSATVAVKACADAACTALYPGTVNLTLSENASNTSFNGGNGQSFTGGQKDVTLVRTSGTGNVTIGTTGSISPTPTNATTCLSDTGATNCTVTFANACFDAAETNGIPPKNPIYTKLAGQSISLDILAVSGGGIDTGYRANNLAVSLVDPTAPSGNCGDTNAGLMNIGTVSFTGTNPQGRRPVTFTYPNAAKNVKVRVIAGGVASCSKDNFAIRPTTFKLTSSATSQPTAPTPTDSYAAGRNFTLTATGMATVNPPVPVTGGYSGTPAMNFSLVSTDPVTTPIPLSGTFAAGDGVKSEGTDFQYQEVGAVAISQNNAVTDATFTAADQVTGVVNGVDHGLNQDCLPDSVANTTGSDPKRHGCVIGSDAITLGRFRPDHFALSSGSIITRSKLSCTPASSFTYIGEPMSAAFTLTAQNAGNQTTQNYAGSSWAKLDPLDVNQLHLGAVNSTPRTPFQVCGTTPCITPETASGTFVSGVANISLSFSVGRDLVTPRGPYSSLYVGVAPVDSDGVTLGSFDLATGDNAGNNDHGKINTSSVEVRYGRLKLGNANGSELLNLPMPMRLEYWDDTKGYFVLNDQDSCTSLLPKNGVLQQAVNITPNGIAATPGSIVFSGGKALLLLNKPAAVTDKGSVDLCIDLDNSTPRDASCQASVRVNMPWLQGRWSGTNYDDDPAARATFGVYKGGRVIYLRELY